ARLAQDMGQAGSESHSSSAALGGFETPQAGNFAARGMGSGKHSAGFVAPQSTAQQHPTQLGGPIQEGAYWSQESMLVGFLVSFDKNEFGAVFELRVGRLIVTCEAAGAGNYLVIEDETVSPMHAIMRITAAGEIQVLDQLSEFGTKVQRFGSDKEDELSGDKSSLEHGDVIKFGNRVFYVCVIARSDNT
ncbi:MAG: FHA domain-containing protein, partial [Bdellovibrionales bacterium]|nr:FHA domain-containing protein [Bdellovibrionales bacterium]